MNESLYVNRMEDTYFRELEEGPRCPICGSRMLPHTEEAEHWQPGDEAKGFLCPKCDVIPED